MIAICLPTSLKSACWAQAEQDKTTSEAADAALRNQDFVMKVKRVVVRNFSRNCHGF
jgi:hypothetical protein